MISGKEIYHYIVLNSRLMKGKITILCTVWLVLLAPLNAQRDLKKADKLLSLKAYQLAIDQYNHILKYEPENAICYAQLEEAYRMTNQTLLAQKAYETAFKLSDKLDQEYVLQYAHTLKKLGLYAQAESWYAEYGRTNPAISDHFIASVNKAKELLSENDNYDIQSFDANSEESDFGIAFFEDKLVFASFREGHKRTGEKLNESYIHQKGNQLYIVGQEGFISNESVRYLRADDKELYHLGPVSYSRDAKMVAYMRNNFTAASNYIFSDEADMGIYFAITNETGDFADPKPFSYNQLEYSYAFPHLAFDGNALYFSSNKPGGYGGFDLYVSYLKNGKWSNPENLGPSINSIGNEITPSFQNN